VFNQILERIAPAQLIVQARRSQRDTRGRRRLMMKYQFKVQIVTVIVIIIVAVVVVVRFRQVLNQLTTLGELKLAERIFANVLFVLVIPVDDRA
jgi:hypothetical protein